MLIDWLAFYCVYYVEMNATEPCVSSKKRTAADLLECEELFADEDVEHDNESDYQSLIMSLIIRLIIIFYILICKQFFTFKQISCGSFF